MEDLEQQYMMVAKNAADYTEERIYAPIVKMLKKRDDGNISCEAAVKYCKLIMLPKLEELRLTLAEFEHRCELNGVTEQFLYSTFLINAVESNTQKCVEYFSTEGEAKKFTLIEFWSGARHIKNLLAEYRNVNSLTRTGQSSYKFNKETADELKIGMTYFEAVTLFQMPPTKSTANTATWNNGKRGASALKLTIKFTDENIITEIIR